MAYAKGIYTSGTESKKKKKTPDPAKSQPTVQKPVKPETVNVPAQTANEAKQEQLRDQQYRARQMPPDTEAEPVHKPVKPAAVNVPAQSSNAARAEQLAAQQRRRQQAEPRKGQSLAAAKEQAEEAWQRWLWREDYNPNNPTKLEDFYRKAGIPLSQNASFDGRVPTLEQLQEAVQRDRAETLSTEAARREQAARRKRELEELDARMEREWYSDDPQWQATHRDVDEAREEQLAARRYQEQREREQKAYDLSTQAALDEKLALRKGLAAGNTPGYTETEQEKKAGEFWKRVLNAVEYRSPEQEYLELLAAKNAEQKQEEIVNALSTQGAMDEKLAERRYWNNVAVESYVRRKGVLPNPGVLYNEHTGEIYIPANKEDGAGSWEAFSMGKRVHVDPKVERRFSWLSQGLAVVKSAEVAVELRDPTIMLLQPIAANLIKAKLLANKYQTQNYVMNNPHTNEIGVSYTVTAGKQIGESVSLAADCYGNVAIMYSKDKGVSTTVDISGGAFHTKTDSPLVKYLEGISAARGGSVSLPTAPVDTSLGTDIVAFCNPYTGKGYYGLSVNGSISLVPINIPMELHDKTTETTIAHMIQLMDEIYPEEGRDE